MNESEPTVRINSRNVNITPQDITRFLTKINKNGPIPERFPELGQCWIFTGGISENGYGAFFLNGMNRRAHVISYRISHDCKEIRLLVCHHCDNPSCINPGHLWLGTPSDNAIDMVKKERANPPYGERCSTARLKESDIHFIRESPLENKVLAKMFGVKPNQITRIISRERWGHI